MLEGKSGLGVPWYQMRERCMPRPARCRHRSSSSRSRYEVTEVAMQLLDKSECYHYHRGKLRTDVLRESGG